MRVSYLHDDGWNFSQAYFPLLNSPFLTFFLPPSSSSSYPLPSLYIAEIAAHISSVLSLMCVWAPSLPPPPLLSPSSAFLLLLFSLLLIAQKQKVLIPSGLRHWSGLRSRDGRRTSAPPPKTKKKKPQQQQPKRPPSSSKTFFSFLLSSSADGDGGE